MNRYIITDEAIQDLENISDYFLRNNLEAGEQFLQAFNARCRQLMMFPNLGRSYAHLRPDLLGLSLRGFIILSRLVMTITRSGLKFCELLMAEEISKIYLMIEALGK
jgi:toxin ParE1/3/4